MPQKFDENCGPHFKKKKKRHINACTHKCMPVVLGDSGAPVTQPQTQAKNPCYTV